MPTDSLPTPALYATPLTLIRVRPAQNQSLGINLNGTDYRLRLLFNDTDPFDAGGTWILDIGDAEGTPIVCGIPVLTGQNLLEPYAYLDIGGGGALFCYGPGHGVEDKPGWNDLGDAFNLYFAPFTARFPELSGVATIPPGLARYLLAGTPL